MPVFWQYRLTKCLTQRSLQTYLKQNPCNPRYLHSETGVWPKIFDREVSKDVEAHWKEKIKKYDNDNLKIKSQEKKDKYYVLSMFPYPSGQLHMGHVRVYTISDAMARYHRLTGKEVMHPMGWDAFGLPAENAAIERGEMPDKWTYSNIANMKKQLEDLGCSFDWSREYATCDPEYYKWTQFLFVKMLEKGLVYQKEAPVNWDPVDKTVLADEQIDENGCSWRSGALVEKKFLRQWYIKTTAYSKSLIDGLENVDPEFWKDIVLLQKHWIGDCDGCRIEFIAKHEGVTLEPPLSVFTKTPQALYGASHIVISPEHYLAVEKYMKESSKNTDCELNIHVVNPFTGANIPIYVSPGYDFGEYLDAHIGIPSVCKEDKEFALKKNIPYQDIIETNSSGEKVLVDSGEFSGIDFNTAAEAITSYAKEKGFGGHVTSERARDWLISRQRYWGTPIPIIHCPTHGAVPVPKEDLPVKLPKITKFTGKGESPLANAEEWVKAKCPKCGGPARRETDTMDTFVDSSWYYLRYLDATNTEAPFSVDTAKKYMPVDLYIGGKEHAIMHLYYARFFNHFMNDEGMVPVREPFVHLLTQGMVMGESYKLKESGRYIRPEEVEVTGKKLVEKETGAPVTQQWEKMSKSKYNGVDPKVVLEEYGTDSTRLCILSNVAPKTDRQWSNEAYTGILRWQFRIWSLVHDLIYQRTKEVKACHLTDKEIKQAEAYLKDSRNYFLNEISYHMKNTFLLNVALSRMQGLTNALRKTPLPLMQISQDFERTLCDLVVMMAPFAPMFASELWSGIQSIPNKQCNYHWERGVLDQHWPVVDKDYKLNIKVKMNRKDCFEVKLDIPLGDEESLSNDKAIEMVKSHKDFNKYFENVNDSHFNLMVLKGYKVEMNCTMKKQKKQKTQVKNKVVTES